MGRAVLIATRSTGWHLCFVSMHMYARSLSSAGTLLQAGRAQERQQEQEPAQVQLEPNTGPRTGSCWGTCEDQ